MQRPMHRKTIIGSVLFFLLFFLSVTLTSRAADSVILTSMEKQENPNHTRVSFNFTRLPEYRSEQSGQRLDLLLDHVEVSPSLHKLPEDETVIEILLAQKPGQLLASLLLRRAPKQVVVEAQRNPDRIVMDIYWDSDGGMRPGVVFRIADMPPKKAGRRAARYQRKSPWEGRWFDFFRHYRQEWALKVPLKFSLPRLPILITDEQSPLWPLQEHANKDMYLSLLQSATQLTDLDDQQRYLRDVLVAEAQLRTGAIAAGVARLHRLAGGGGSEHVRVEYLTAYGDAVGGQPLVAQIKLLELLEKLPTGHAFEALSRLSAVETSLAANLDEVALEHSEQKRGDWPESMAVIADLRRADALAGSGKRDRALTIYRDLIEKSGLFENYIFSCNRAAHSAFKQGEYQFAADLYRKLAEQIKGHPGEALALFATGASAFEAGDLAWGTIGLQRATLDRPGTEGADRGELRLIDLQVIKEGELGLAKAVMGYQKLGNRSQYRSIREEALFKRALGLYLLMEYQQSVEELMVFRRNFRTSALSREVDLLLLEQLPKVVHQFLQDKNDLQAVVLVEQNRQLLLGNGFDQPFLYDLAKAFEKLGLYERSGRVLLYLLDRTRGSADQEQVYLPLARTFLKRDEFAMASTYAKEYLQKYPQGDNAGAVFGILLDALEGQKREQELMSWLSRKNRPRSVELEKRAAAIYWKLGRLDQVISSLEWVQNNGRPLEVKEMAQLAEAYYQTEQNRQAEKIYQSLRDDAVYGAQAGYRTAQLLLRRQDRKSAIRQLEQTVEGNIEGPWTKLARDLLRQVQG